MRKSLRLEELDVYRVAMEIGELAWNAVDKWKHFEKKTLGIQFVNAADSIALNISEGYGRFHFKENKQFCYYSRGSAKETATIALKARDRRLLTAEEYDVILSKLTSYFRLIYPYILTIGTSKVT